jgi:uncharacterized protein involved in cysteine biosynthesis
MFASVRKTLTLISDPAFGCILAKALLFTLLLFTVLLVGSEYLLTFLPVLGSLWINDALRWLAPLLFLLGSLVLGPSVAALFASLFLDQLAAHLEKRDYPESLWRWPKWTACAGATRAPFGHREP